MTRTTVTRKLALAGFVPAGKISHSHFSLLPVLAIWLVTAAWSQNTLGVRGPRIVPGAGPLAKPAPATPATAEYDFITIKIPGSTGANAFNINDGRLVTGDYLDASGNWHGFLWLDGSVHTLDEPGALDSLPSAASNQGVVIGIFGNSTTGSAATYSLASGVWTTLPDVPGVANNYGTGINDLGVAVGEAGSNLQGLEAGAFGACNVAWIWDPLQSAYSFFSVPGAVNGTCPFGVNNQRQVAGGIYDQIGAHGFLKDGESFTTIDVPGAAGTGGSWINNRGEIVGSWFDASGANHGYVRSAAGQFTTVDVPGSSGSAAYGINDRGDLCGYYSDAVGVSYAYVALKR